MEKYENLEIEIIEFEADDIITNSPDSTPEGGGDGI